MAAVPTDFSWSIFHQEAYTEACPGLFLDSGKSSKLIALQECSPSANSPILSQDSASTEVENEKTSSLTKRREASIDLQHVVIQTNDDLESYQQSATGARKFIIEHVDHSWSRLNITKSLFDYLCFHLRSSDALRYMITYFGERRRCDEIRPPLPQCQSRNDAHGNLTLEISYTLRYIALNQNGDPQNPWSLRQFAVHAQQRDTDHSSWLLIAPPKAVVPCFADSVSATSKSVSTDFAPHIFLIEYAVTCWRPYLYYLTEEVDKCNAHLECAAPPAKIKIDLATLRLRLKNLEDRVEDVKVSLQSNEAVIQTIGQLHVSVGRADQDSGIDLHGRGIDIKNKCSNYALTSEAMMSQLSTLRNKILSCTQITSSFSELANGEALQELTRSANSEAQRAAGDAAIMKGLTVIASIFLPTTVVLNFFSASFIDISDNKMHLVDKWWLFAAVSGPLTASTLILWILWMQYQRRQSKRFRGDSGQASIPVDGV